MRLSDAISEYLSYREGAGYAPATVRIERYSLQILLAEIGNINVKHLDTRHGETYNAHLLAKGLKPNSINAQLSSAMRFCKWARTRRYLPAAVEPFSTIRLARGEAPPRRRLDAHDFPRLLAACIHPQQRIIVALGLYLFLRASEIRHLKVGDVRLDRGEVLVYQPKTKRYDEMPICAELDAELRRWLTWYSEDAAAQHGPLQDENHLVPARKGLRFINDGTGRGGGVLVEPENGKVNPHRPAGAPYEAVKKALEAIGWHTEGAREGCHTLRRSGARALFEELLASGEVRDGVLRQVQSMLHHKSVQMTERYLGIEADAEKRNLLLRGRAMFTARGENVVDIRPAREVM